MTLKKYKIQYLDRETLNLLLDKIPKLLQSNNKCQT